MSFVLDYVLCDKCSQPVVLRQDTFAWPEEDQKWIETDTQPLVAACPNCKHVGNYDNRPLKTLPSPEGLSPARPDATMHVFRLNVSCGTAGCKTPLSVIAIRNRNTSVEALLAETDGWTWEGLKCPTGHEVPPRTIRIESTVSLKCLNPECGAMFNYPLSWFVVGNRIDCGFCGKRFVLTKEQVANIWKSFGE